jgi:uncharacterized protein (DUF1501 family)
MKIDRRQFLAAAGTGAALALWPRLGLGGDANRRLLVVLLRGGLDGLHALQPWADPAYGRLRGALADGTEALRLDGSFALHPALGFAAGLYGKGQLLPVVAVAPPYRQRSHFEAQDCLENGTDAPGGSHNGWLNRAVAALPGTEGLAIAGVMPLILRGEGDAGTWSPPLPQAVDPQLLERLLPLYAHDPELGDVFARAAADDLQAGDVTGKARRRLADLAASAARFMAAPDGPQIGFLEDSGWDTHTNEARTLARKLAELDDALKAFHEHAAPIWAQTAIVVVSEFGRTAAVNGTEGTDHGTGGLALLAGGAVNGGRIAGDWPGLGRGDLFEARDLRATTDLRAVFKGVLAGHLGVRDAALEELVFPGSREVAALDGLLA